MSIISNHIISNNIMSSSNNIMTSNNVMSNYMSIIILRTWHRGSDTDTPLDRCGRALDAA